ncbi:MAG: hypothetical protein C0422_09725 [Alcaligenaceae bacterium]|nr:hypothetical protein [Alcaligenaceae bacterium]
MENGTDWPTWIQAFTSVLAILLAVFMPGILKEVERRDKALAIVGIFKLSIREVHNHVLAMGNVLQSRLGQYQYPKEIKIEVFGKVIKKLEPMVNSQFELMRSVTAVDLPFPGMAVIPSTLESSVEMLIDDVDLAIQRDKPVDEILAKYKWHRNNIHELIKECDATLNKIQDDLSPHPVVRMLKRAVVRLRDIN